MAGRCWFTAVAFGALLTPNLATSTSLQVVSDCAAKAPGNVSGIQALNAACPGLDAALQDIGIDVMLGDGWRDHLNQHGLVDIAALIESYDGTPARAAPNTAALAQILHTLDQKHSGAARTWWDGMTAWLRDWLAHSNSSFAVWLRKLFDEASVSPSLLKVFAYGLTAVLAVLALTVVVLEIKMSGIARGRGAAKVAKRPGTSEALIVANLVPAHARDELSELLRSLVQRLLQTGRLEVERSLTHRELVDRSVLDDDLQRQAFAGVARAAESALYGPRSGDSQPQPPKVLEQGRLLLQQLRQPRPTP